MQQKTLLLVDEHIGATLKIENSIALYPSYEKEVPWSITIDEYYTLNKYLTQLIDNTTEYLAKLPILPIKATIDAQKKLIRPNVAQIFYILTDRLVRILKLVSCSDIAKISLIEAGSFTPPYSKEYLYALARDSWEFNQRIVNDVLSDVEICNISEKKDLFPNGYWNFNNWQYYKGFGCELEPVIDDNFVHKIIKFIKSPRFLHRLGLQASSYGKLLPVMALGYNEYEFSKKGFFWPFGKFCKLPQYWPNFLINASTDYALRDHLSSVTQDYFVENMFNLLEQLGINNVELKKYLKPISKLFFQYYPANMLEDCEKYCTWSIKQLKGYKIKHYFTWDPASSDLGIYYNYAATELGYKVWGMQHSARGGYLSNAPLVAEILIAGTDYYTTSGWEHPEPHLPVWKYKAIPLPSPHYSSIKKSRSKKEENKRTILLAIGEMYRFPVFYDGSYYIDTMTKWSDLIEDIIKCLAEKNIEIVLRLYAPVVSDFIKDAVKKWLVMGGAKIHVSDKINKGLASTLFNSVDATIWDIPAGGFVESLLMGTPSFALWNEDLMRCQPEAENSILKLCEAGLLNKDGADMARNVSECIGESEWWQEPERMQAREGFMTKFIKTNDDWSFEWKQLIQRIEEY